ncbi:Solute-binding protein [Sporomusa silvacetica DSM 10669]|uniref:Solute-binding protein n=1 Tax=Sporomusa silvacetica DSM 10669 TaxID=1123289 RepID=A0ABZ3ITS7_9FIRM|nr:TRAP transporter substrate-binding protein [Sporomusa silvacetica]OZC19602.1 2,3-diketo-L-gulonate-binding periplasmic protein YiaO precursor [Sporomusa silvacetica DSM 10669]
MNTKKLIAGALSLMLAGSLMAGCGGSKAGDKKAAEGAKYTFRLAETHPADYPTTMGDKKFAELVNERTQGRIKIEVFPSSQLGEEKAVIEQIQLGAIEFTRVSASPLAEFNKAFGVFSLPYIFDNNDHMWKFLNGEAGNKILDGLEKSKMKGLAYYDGGARNFYTKNPVTKVEDLKGMKIRVQQSKINMDLISALGASATPMPYGEVYSGLQTGVIDGAENNSPSYFTANHYQAVKNFILDGHQRVPEVLLISKVTWDKLSEEDRKIIKQAAIDSVATQRELWGKFEKESMDKLKANGVVVTEVSDVKPWQAAVKPVIDKYVADYKEQLDAIDQARK